ncbi:MAG TPA: VOC family protein [Bryobacteraceae bacterium]|nr:VOC family protein [Bryobacteraceae bacterium]
MNTTSQNAVEWFEIPTADFNTSIPFYNRVLGLKLEAKEFGPNQIAIFPHQDPGPGGCLMRGPGMVPSGAGSVVYLSAMKIDAAIAQVEAAGGKIVIPKTPIGPGMGFFARFLDLEGNLVGLSALD